MVQNIILADDYKGYRDLLIKHMQQWTSVKQVLPAGNGQEVLDILQKKEIEIVLMDIRMPVLNGFDATKIITSDFPKVKVIVFSQYDDFYTVKRMFDFGAKGYVVKDEGMDELKKGIQAVAENQLYFSKLIRDYQLEIFELNKKAIDTEPLFRETEIKILHGLSEGLSAAEIACKTFLSKRTIDWHKSNMMLKTKTKNVVQLLNFARAHHFIK